MGQARKRGCYEVRVALALERNQKLVAHIQSTGNKKALAALHVLGPKRLATRLVAAGMLYEQK
jgi:hypothetical protein